MNAPTQIDNSFYGIEIEPLSGPVRALRDGRLLAETTAAKVMYETRLDPVIYIPHQDLRVPNTLCDTLQGFCPFKGTASFGDLVIDGDRIPNAIWTYADPLPESKGIEEHVGFMPGVVTKWELGDNRLRPVEGGNLSGPVFDWLLRDAPYLPSPEALTRAFAETLNDTGLSITRLSVMIWSLHPQIVGHNHVWTRKDGQVSSFAPSYELHDHPAFVNSPLRHVSNGLGGVRQKLDSDYAENAFPIMQDLRREGATDYVAMPLPYSDGRTNVITLTTDRAGGFTTAELGLVFECVAVLSRLFEVFTLKENAQSVLETYVGKRSGARVLGGEIRRGDGDEIDAAIMFCDLRHSTRLQERLGRDAYIGLLNDFFETVSTRVHDHGGEVLKFIGDAVLAVFPAGDDPAAARAQALKAAREIAAALDGIDTKSPGLACDCAIGMAYGRVTYGNVGSRARLDFTVIGKAANIAARLGDHGKRHGHRIVVTDEMAQGIDGVTDLGALRLHNVSEQVPACALG